MAQKKDENPNRSGNQRIFALIDKGRVFDDYRALDRIIAETHNSLNTDRRPSHKRKDDDRSPPEGKDADEQPDIPVATSIEFSALTSWLTHSISPAAFENAIWNGLNLRLFFAALERGVLDVVGFNRDFVSAGVEQVELFNAELELLAGCLLKQPRKTDGC